MPHKEPSLLQIGLSLIRLHFTGWRQVRGYTCLNRDDPWKGALYIAVALEKENNR